MPDVNVVYGTDAADALRGTGGADLIYGFDPEGAQANVTGFEATRVAAGLEQSLFATAAPNDDGRLFIVEKQGLIKILNLDTGAVEATPFLDVSGEISAAGEQGLLGLTFHPDFASNGKFYVTLSNVDGDTEVREYTVSAADPNTAAPGSGRLIIRIDQPEGIFNHKAGWLDFGPDGYLYVATGDGGRGQSANSQNTENLLGKILRLDVDGPPDPGLNYAIPADNPFVGQAGADEIWAFGLRNPFRNSFDRGTGDLFIADVGQGSWEEINLGEIGANYGWDFREGPAPYPNSQTPGSPPADLTDPIFSYPHPEGQSVTGGYVYRGSSEGLHGQYFFGDFITGRVWTLRQDDNGDWIREDRTAAIEAAIGGPIGNISSFGEDAEGNLYIVTFAGDVYRVDPQVLSADSGDTINAGAGNDRVYAGAGADRVLGGAGDDQLHGMDGDDRLDGGAGADGLYGGAGVDTASYASATVGVTANLFNEASNAGAAAGDAFADIENLLGSRFADRLVGDRGGNLLNGSDGGDVLNGLGGDDVLIGGLGADILIGGSGADRFRFVDLAQSVNGARDTIRGFARADGDRIDLAAIDADATQDGNQAFALVGTEAEAAAAAGSLFVRADGVVLLNADGDADFEMEIAVLGLSAATASDFLL